MSIQKTALVIGGGPSGLMAAEKLAIAGLKVTLTEAKPTVGRKFLMAGKSGLNLTKNEDFESFMNGFYEAKSTLLPILQDFGPTHVMQWANALEAKVFTGSTRRVFPEAMKASPLLRAWLARLVQSNVDVKTNWRWLGFAQDSLSFDTPQGQKSLTANVCVLAVGGASWSKLGSDGAWASSLADEGVRLTPFGVANAALDIHWSEHMQRFFGTPLKSVSFNVDQRSIRGEAVISSKGLEGSGVYTISRDLRLGSELNLDLLPDWSPKKIITALKRPKGKQSLNNFLRKVLRLDPVKQALLREFSSPLPSEPTTLARLLKSLPLRYAGLCSIDEAISTSGGIAFGELDETLMIRQKAGVFCAGEMLDWEAPTGGYLITASLATGAWAGRHAAKFALAGTERAP
ncbi:MAG: TIGR03862 family flavoprotein [Paracoccaceae bacterium]|nr:TIGR03862 family flavoprotein [Paracoccaceae bacterium]